MVTGEVIPLGKPSRLNPWNDSVIPSLGSQAPQKISVSVYIGDQYLGEYVTDVIRKEVRI
jgi:hypothetical protein